LLQIKCFGGAGGKIYFLDGIWINVGRTTLAAWVYRTVKNKRRALLSLLSTGLEEPKGNGRKHIIVQIGSDGLSMFGSKPMRDYHEDGRVKFL
jgi:hypothetical protein